MLNIPEKKYLPSGQFVKKVAILFVLIIIVIIIAKIVPAIKDKVLQNRKEKALLVKDLVIQDSNSNGIQDWEESLWGLDPFADGASNKEYILAKKKILNKDNIPEGELTAEDQMAREFFALVVSLKQSGNLNEASMQTLANSIGKKVIATEISDVYTEDMLQIVSTTTATIRAYYNALQKLNTKYKGRDIGGELALIGQAIATSDPQALRVAILSANDYRAFGKDLIAIPVPSSLAITHLQLANNYEKSAVSLESMSTILDSPTIGMTTLIRYKKYNDSLVQNLEELTTFFKKNGIIK